MKSNQKRSILVKAGMVGIISLIALFLACGFAGAEPLSDSQVVLIKIDPSVISITDITTPENIVHDYTPSLPGTYAIKVPSGENQNDAITQYSAIPGVIYAEPDFEVQIFTPTSEPSTSQPTTQATQKSPVPLAGLIAGLGGAAFMLAHKRK